MDEQKQQTETDGGPQQEKKLSRTTLTFYIIGLFSIAIALILISYVAQSRANTLADQLTEQQTVTQGATQKMEGLQRQYDLQSKALDDVRDVLDTEQAKTDVVGAAKTRMEERDVYAALASISVLRAEGKTAAAERALTALTEKYGEARLDGTAHDAFGEDISALFADVQKLLQLRVDPEAPAEEENQ